MTEYICYDCEYSTKIRTHYQRHLATNKHLKNCGKEKNKNINLPLYTAENPHKTAEIAQKGINPRTNTAQNRRKPAENHTNQKYTFSVSCEYCSREFTRLDTKTRHLNKFCKAKILKDKDDEDNKKEIEQLKNQIDKLIDKVNTPNGGNTYHTHIGNKTSTTTTNNKMETNNTLNLDNSVNLNIFGKENLSMLTDEVKKELIKGPYKMMPKLLEMIYFNKKFPENHTMKMVNKNKELMKVHKKSGWELVDKIDTIDYLLEDKNYHVDNFYDENSDEFSQFIKRTYKNFRRLFDNRDKDLWKQIKRDVDLLLWNNM